MTGSDGHLALKRNVKNLTAQFEMISKRSRSSVEMKSQNPRRSEEMKSQKSRSEEMQSAVEARSQSSRMSEETRSLKCRSEEMKSQKSRMVESQSQRSRNPEKGQSQKSEVSEETHSQNSRSVDMKSQTSRRSVDNYVKSKQEVLSSKLEDNTADDQYHETQRLLRNLKNRRRKWNKEPISKETLEGIVKEYAKEAEEETDVLDSYSPTNIVYNLNAENINDDKIEVSQKETDRNEETEDTDDVEKNMVHFNDERMETDDEVNEIPDILNTQEKPRALSNTDGQPKLSNCVRYLLNVSLTALFVILSTRLIFFS